MQRGFGGAVVRVAGPRVNASKGTDVDDAAVNGAEMRQSFAGNEKRTAGVGFEDCVPLRESEAFERGRLEDGGVVDEDIDAVVEGYGCGDGGPHGCLGADIAKNCLGPTTEGSNSLRCGGGFIV